MQVLDSGRLSAGPMMAQFERDFAELHGHHFGLMSNSGTSALQIALAACKERHGWQDGDEVIVPAVTFIATSNVVVYNNLRPVFVDVEPGYYCIDPARIEAAITPRTRAIMPVHIAGLPCDMAPIVEIAARHHLRILEDSAEAMFVHYRGRPVGSFSDIASFSTYVAHIISTGVGGLNTTSDPEYQTLLRSLANHGRDSIYTRIDDDQGRQGRALFEIANRRFSFVRFGQSYRSTEMEAALGIAELEQRHEYHARRCQIVAAFQAGLARFTEHLQLPAVRPECEHAWMFYPLTVRSDAFPRAALIQFLEERGVETRYLLPLISQPLYRARFGNLDDQCPVASWLNERAFAIGCHPQITDEEVSWVLETFADFFASRA